MTTTAAVDEGCPWCGSWTSHHIAICPAVQAIEFHPNGMVSRVEKVKKPDLMLDGWMGGSVSSTISRANITWEQGSPETK